MRISDWSSDVCSSDLRTMVHPGHGPRTHSVHRSVRHSSHSHVIHAERRSRKQRWHLSGHSQARRQCFPATSGAVCGLRVDREGSVSHGLTDYLISFGNGDHTFIDLNWSKIISLS